MPHDTPAAVHSTPTPYTTRQDLKPSGDDYSARPPGQLRPRPISTDAHTLLRTRHQRFAPWGLAYGLSDCQSRTQPKSYPPGSPVPLV